MISKQQVILEKNFQKDNDINEFHNRIGFDINELSSASENKSKLNDKKVYLSVLHDSLLKNLRGIIDCQEELKSNKFKRIKLSKFIEDITIILTQ